MKAEDRLLVAREGFEIRSRILGCEVLRQSAGAIAGGSFVSAFLDPMSIPSQTIDEISYRVITYLRCFDVNPTVVAEEHDACRSA